MSALATTVRARARLFALGCGLFAVVLALLPLPLISRERLGITLTLFLSALLGAGIIAGIGWAAVQGSANLGAMLRLARQAARGDVGMAATLPPRQGAELLLLVLGRGCVVLGLVWIAVWLALRGELPRGGWAVLTVPLVCCALACAVSIAAARFTGSLVAGVRDLNALEKVRARKTTDTAGLRVTRGGGGLPISAAALMTVSGLLVLGLTGIGIAVFVEGRFAFDLTLVLRVLLASFLVLVAAGVTLSLWFLARFGQVLAALRRRFAEAGWWSAGQHTSGRSRPEVERVLGLASLVRLWALLATVGAGLATGWGLVTMQLDFDLPLRNFPLLRAGWGLAAVCGVPVGLGGLAFASLMQGWAAVARALVEVQAAALTSIDGGASAVPEATPPERWTARAATAVLALGLLLALLALTQLTSFGRRTGARALLRWTPERGASHTWVGWVLRRDGTSEDLRGLVRLLASERRQPRALRDAGWALALGLPLPELLALAEEMSPEEQSTLISLRCMRTFRLGFITSDYVDHPLDEVRRAMTGAELEAMMGLVLAHAERAESGAAVAWFDSFVAPANLRAAEAWLREQPPGAGRTLLLALRGDGEALAALLEAGRAFDLAWLIALEPRVLRGPVLDRIAEHIVGSPDDAGYLDVLSELNNLRPRNKLVRPVLERVAALGDAHPCSAWARRLLVE